MSNPMDWDKILEEQAKDPGFAPVPAGKYPVRVEEADAVVASTGNEMLKVQFVLVGGPYDGRKCFTNIVFAKDNPTAMRFTLRKLNALGVSREVIAAQKPDMPRLASMIVGAEAEAELTIKEYEGEKSNEVKTLRSLTAAASAPTPPIGAPPIPEPEKPKASPPPAPPIPIPEPETAPDPEEPF